MLSFSLMTLAFVKNTNLANLNESEIFSL